MGESLRFSSSNDLFLPLGYLYRQCSFFFNVNYLRFFHSSLLFKSINWTNSSNRFHHLCWPCSISNRLKTLLKTFLLLAFTKRLMVVLASCLFALGASHGWSAAEVYRNPITYGSTGFLSVIQACLPLNIWRALLILFSVVGFYASAVVLKNLIEISQPLLSQFIWALMAYIYRSLYPHNDSAKYTWLKREGQKS